MGTSEMEFPVLNNPLQKAKGFGTVQNTVIALKSLGVYSSLGLIAPGKVHDSVTYMFSQPWHNYIVCLVYFFPAVAGLI